MSKFISRLSPEQRIRLYLDDRYRIRQRTLHHNSTKVRNGLKGAWTEFQIWDGRKIIGRHDTYKQACVAVTELIEQKVAEGLSRLRSQP